MATWNSKEKYSVQDSCFLKRFFGKCSNPYNTIYSI